MSGVVIVGTLLEAYAPFVAVVSAGRLSAGLLPEGVALPNVLLRVVSRTEWRPLARMAGRPVTERVQVTVRAGTYAQIEQILTLVRAACADRTGTIASFVNVAVLLDGTGPDFTDDDASIFMRSLDLRVSFTEPA